MTDTPTPTPTSALTDEQIDGWEPMGSSPADDAQIDDDVRALVEGESMPEETAWAIIAAAIARAKREAAEEIARQVNASADALIDGNSYWCGHIDGMRIAAKIAREVTNA